MKPGDLIEWYYRYDLCQVVSDEKLWSSLMKRWVPIGIISTFLHQDKETYSWINSKGCFHARVEDRTALRGQEPAYAGVSTRAWKID